MAKQEGADSTSQGTEETPAAAEESRAQKNATPATEEATSGPTAPSKGEAPESEAEAGKVVEGPDREELTRLLEDARSKADDHYNAVVRARAELDNLRKRQKRELENAHKFALENFVQALLPVKDSMELGLSAASEETADVPKLREGSELTLKLLVTVLEKFGVEEVNPEGEPFNPDLHQAMSLQPRDDVPPNTVVTVVQKGYTLNGRLVRPAMVMVSQAAAGNLDQQA